MHRQKRFKEIRTEILVELQRLFPEPYPIDDFVIDVRLEDEDIYWAALDALLDEGAVVQAENCD